MVMGRRRARPKPHQLNHAIHDKVPRASNDDNNHLAALQKRQFSCNSPSFGLTTLDCIYLSQIGVHSQGPNPLSPSSSSALSSANGQPEHAIWIGSEGPNLFTFINSADVPVILILWEMAVDDGQASFMNARQPAITYSLPTTGSAVQISIANNVPGGWAVIYNRTTRLTEYGQVDNTFGEFSTGAWATIDVSRLVNMQGDGMSVTVMGSGKTDDEERKPNGVCVSDLSTCVYACNEGLGNTCGEEGTYSLLNCQGQPGSVQSWDSDGNPTGGCQGWSWGGNINVVLTRRGQHGVGSWAV
ncbi:hypothetical protein V8F20_005972 [Naviculisporaceae sp. PSN 640]